MGKKLWYFGKNYGTYRVLWDFDLQRKKKQWRLPKTKKL